MSLSKNPQQLHRDRFGTKGAAFQAPGRVNLIGEHTDTSEGFVMPAALDLRTVSVLSPRRDSTANIYSANFGEASQLDLTQMPSVPRKHWSDYVAGIVWTLQQRGIRFEGFDMTLSGDVPLGSGLSSSASVEVAAAMALLTHAGVAMSKPEIARLCQSTENKFIGAQSGIMDPLASCCGSEGQALLLDCRSLEFGLLPLPKEAMLVICNTMVKHALSDGGSYNQRRVEFEQGLKILQSHRPEIRTLRDVSEEELRSHEQEMPRHVFLRCLHVVTENRRVIEAAEALRRHDLTRFGELMYQAHASMRDNYAASCAEADILVDLAAQQPGCYGARITGGGFGGCTVNLVAADYAGKFVENVRAGYEKATGIRSEIYLCRASDGAGPMQEE